MELYNFPKHIKGDTFKSRSIFFNFDLTGASIKMQFKLKGNKTVAYEWTSTNGSIEIVLGTSGEIIIKQMLLNPPVGIYYYDLQITNILGLVRTIIGGSLEVKQNITT
jgi:hypothetical protein